MKEKVTLYLRRAVETDLDMLFHWANDEDVRKNSFCPDPIEYNDHVIWFQKMIQNENIDQYILEDEDIPVGQIRLNRNGDVGEISYSIAPEKRGMGYGKAICQLLIRKVREQNPKIKKLVAKVKPSNASSAYCFEKNGFVESYSQYEIEIATAVFDDNLLSTSKHFRGGVLYLTNNRNTFDLYDWICKRCDAAFLYSDRLSADILKRIKPDLVVSYNYSYIVPRECIDQMEGKMINLHISLLPWNRGCSPNIWSFIDGTPKGVTIHQMSAGLDKGEILFQKEIEFNSEKETFETTHRKLNDEIVTLFKNHWDEIYSGEYKNYIHKQEGIGTYHSSKDLRELCKVINFKWSDNIKDFLVRYKKAGQK